ncbi:polyphosphate polymerase domain-containing protein [Candidatus Sumerlaeota bacterium]|nr:polyphosphate polymerase domain-containing protein [Candidatus Sumerlaeota bacterium]
METAQKNITRNLASAFQRFEAKYIISEAQARAVRHFIQPYVMNDPFAQDQAFYPIYSLYLDSPDMKLYWMSELGMKNRFKLRVRWYNERGDAPIFLEIKRRIDNTIRKERKMIRPEFLSNFFRTQMRAEELPIPFFPHDMDHVLLFFDYMRQLRARPRVVARYMREAYVCRMDHSTRITFDRNLQCVPAICCPDLEKLARNIWYSLPYPSVILEIKFNCFFPVWVQKMIEQLSLSRDSISKYLVAVKELNRLGFRFEG